jgi:hypothetical protein
MTHLSQAQDQISCAPGEGLSLAPRVHRTSLFPMSCSFESPAAYCQSMSNLLQSF